MVRRVGEGVGVGRVHGVGRGGGRVGVWRREGGWEVYGEVRVGV